MSHCTRIWEGGREGEREREREKEGRERERERREKEIIWNTLPLPSPIILYPTLCRGQPRPTPRKPRVPRKTVGTPQSSQSSVPLSPSSSTSSLSEGEEPSSAKKSVNFELPCIPEGQLEGGRQGEGDNADDFLRKLRERRMAAKEGGKKHVTADANINTEKRSGVSEMPVQAPASKTYSRTSVQPESARLSQSTPSLSMLRQPLTSPSVEPLPQTTPTPTPPSGGGQGEAEESDDSSSEKFSTPPTTAEQLATAISSSHTPQDPPTPVVPSTSESATEYDPILEGIKRRRLELKQQRELSGKKSNASDSPPTTTETKTETEKIETFPPPMGPTQLSTTANSSQYSGGGDGGSRQTSTVDANSSLIPGVYCPKCYCKVHLGDKYCRYCGEAVYTLFTNKKPPTAGSSTAGGTAANSGIATFQDRSKATGYDEGVSSTHPGDGTAGSGQLRTDPHRYQPGSNVPTLPPKPGPSKPTDQSFLYDSSGRPMRASVPPEDDTASKQPPQALPPLSSSHQLQRRQAAGQQQQPLRARVDDSQSSTAYYGQSGLSSSQAASTVTGGGGGGVASAGASGYTPTPPVGEGILQYSEKLKRFREFLHKKGKTDSEIDSDPDYLLMVEEEKKKQPKQSIPIYGNVPVSSNSSSTAATAAAAAAMGAPGRPNVPTDSAKVDRYGGRQQPGPAAHRPNLSDYGRVNLLDTGNYSSENQRAMEKLKSDGQQLLNWIKVQASSFLVFNKFPSATHSLVSTHTHTYMYVPYEISCLPK